MTAQAQVKASGRRVVMEGAPYAEGWAQRHPYAQGRIERDRLRKGKARHRAHRDPLPVRERKQQ